MKQRLQSAATPAQQPTGDADRTRGARELQWRYGWIGPADALAHLGIGSLSALYRLIKGYRLPHGRVGVHYRFRRHDLDQWVAEHGTALRLVKGA